jgi:DNA methylase
MRVGFDNGTFYQGDCFEVMRSLPDRSVDMVLCDLPYGTTQNKWDSVLPLEPLWAEYWRLCKGAVVLTAAQPFTSLLVMSQLDKFKYDWVWRKPKGTGHLNAKKMPMRDKEDILVFAQGAAPYNPQFGTGEPYKNKAGKVKATGLTDNYGDFGTHREGSGGGRYPKQVVDFGVVERGTLHPTQKPVALFEYLIKTYTNPGDTVLDNTAGSGTTAIAAENCGRKWVCIERDETYTAKAVDRIKSHVGIEF